MGHIVFVVIGGVFSDDNLVSLKSMTTITVLLCLHNKLLCLKKVILSAFIIGGQSKVGAMGLFMSQARKGFKDFSNKWKTRSHIGSERDKRH
jgi:hypothetical protein